MKKERGRGDKEDNKKGYIHDKSYFQNNGKILQPFLYTHSLQRGNGRRGGGVERA